MPIITLTSDWKNNDYYVGSIKGKILCLCPDITIIDISHSIQSFSISQAAYVVRYSYSDFPEGTIHIIAVNSEHSPDKPHIAVRAMNQYFIACDNGLITLIIEKDPDEAVVLPEKMKGNAAATDIDIFARTACELAKGRPLKELGKKHINLKRQVPMLPTIDESVINGTIVYIDSFRNAITNINKALFDKIGRKRKFDIYIQSNHYRVSKINKYYSESSVGDLLVLFNSIGFLEIAINNGNAADLLNLSTGSAVRIKFYG
ncbi:MAG: SAM-dependent chlorinase/fluorinase [Bacteroidales bacterium]|nr:SAM-dependent chlorinase/fluorinase [Bacteroidales bacterium]